MSEFDLFEEFSDANSGKNLTEEIVGCIHKNIGEHSGILSCIDCGEEVGKNIAHDKEWRYYGQSDTKHKSDPSRCQMRKIDDKSIMKDIDTLGFSDRITNTANMLYKEVTSGRIHRGNSRKAIIFACIFHAYKICGNPQSCDNLIEIFNLDRKSGLKGLKYFNLHIPKQSITVKDVHITPVNIIGEILSKFSATVSQKNEVINVYNKIKDKPSKIGRARPQSIAAGITFYWMQANNKNISIEDFIEKVGLSELTITRISKEVEQLLEA